MESTDMATLVSSRYTGDISLLKAIRKDGRLLEQQKRLVSLRDRSQMRMHLLANAMRVADGILPDVNRAMVQLSERVDVGKPLEAFVYADSQINAFVTETRSHFLVGISSGAVTLLKSNELEFVIGHELGHVLFGHMDVAATQLTETDELSLHQGRLLRSWQRAAEVSADRAGLLCCNDLLVACSALLKTLTGLSLQLPSVEYIDQQWESLLEELLDEGSGNLWAHSHPFPPIRIKALAAFWDGHLSSTVQVADEQVANWLSVMDAPGAVSSNDSQPSLLARFLFYGGLFVATADGALPEEARRRLDALTVPGVDLDSLMASDADIAHEALEGFRAAKASRRNKLRSSELASLMRQLVAFAAIDNVFSDNERARLKTLANELRVADRAVDMLIERHEEVTP